MIYLLAPWLALALPGLIGAAGSMLGRAQSRGDIARQNAYNSPAQQVRRLREAGLPIASLDGTAQAGSQSALPEISGDKIGESIGSYMSTSIQKKQIEMMDAQIEANKAQALSTQQEAQGRALDNQMKMLDPMEGDPISYNARLARLDVEGRQIQNDLSANRRDIETIDYWVKKDLWESGHLTKEVRQRISNMVMTWRSMKQAYDNTEKQMKAINTMIEAIEKDGMTTGEAFMHTLTQGMFSRMQPIQYYRDER